MEKRIRLTENDLKALIKEAIVKEAPGLPMMILNGRRESTNIDDRRGQAFDYAAGIADNIDKMVKIEMYVAIAGQDNAFEALFTDKSITKAMQNAETAYQKAQQVMGSFMQRAGIQMRNGVNKVRGMFNETTFGGALEGLDIVGAMKRLFLSSVSLFVTMVDNYILAVQGGKMNPNNAFKQISESYKKIMAYFPKK